MVAARMRILITGNMGYVGSVLIRHLRATHCDACLIGYDSGYFAHCVAGGEILPEALLDRQHFGDVRDFPAGLLDGIDAVVHLAAISNDPMGHRFESLTDEINFRASIAIADAAQVAGVRNYVFASTCSVYGGANGAARRESDEVAPLTAYARSKIDAERILRQMSDGQMTVTCLRFGTACGMSPRLRLDLVLNDFVAGALENRRIDVLSDGTPWRPLIDVADMARAIEWAIFRKAESGGAFLAINVGADDCNYQVQQLAEAVAVAVPGTKISVNAGAARDGRSYRVDFSLFQALAPEFVPQVTLAESISDLRNGMASMRFADSDFRNSRYMRLKAIEDSIAAGRLTPELRWATSHP